MDYESGVGSRPGSRILHSLPVGFGSSASLTAGKRVSKTDMNGEWDSCGFKF